jgi:hypothetical protein
VSNPRHGKLAVTKEPSGEIRVALSFPKRSQAKAEKFVPRWSDAAGCRALVYSKISGESLKTRAGRGALPRVSEFSNAARRAVKNACGALKTLFGKRIVFGTLTLPGSTDEARKTFASWSAVVIEHLNKWRSYHAPSSLWVYKWEWQKNGALHLHFAIGAADILRLRRLERAFTEYVHLLLDHLSDVSGTDLFARGDGGSWRGFPEILRSRLEPVRKCVKRYMAKYLVKPEVGSLSHCPSRWWGQSRELRRAVGCLRCCTYLRSENWAQLVDRQAQARQLVTALGLKCFAYSQPFSPHNTTLLIYPTEGEESVVYNTLGDIVSDPTPPVIPAWTPYRVLD